jgi:hypothetical protein
VFNPECLNSRLSKSKKAEFTSVNEYFFDKCNKEVGHYGQTQIRINLFFPDKLLMPLPGISLILLRIQYLAHN